MRYLLPFFFFLWAVFLNAHSAFSQKPSADLDSLYMSLNHENLHDTIRVKNHLLISLLLTEKILLDSSYRSAERALEIASESDYDLGVKSALIMMGHILNIQGDQISSIELFTREIARARNKNDHSILYYLLMNRGNVYLHLELFDMAEGDLLEAQSLLDKSFDPNSAVDRNAKATLTNNLALAQYHQKKYPQALKSFQSCEALIKPEFEMSMGPRIYVNMANTYYELGNKTLVEEYFEKASNLIGPEDLFTRAFLYANKASIAERENELELASSLCTSALSLAGIESLHDFLPSLYQIQYKIAKSNGQYAEALDYHEKFLVARDSLLGIEKKLEFTRRDLETQSNYNRQLEELRHQSEIKAQAEDHQRNQILGFSIGTLVLLLGAGAWFVYANRKQLSIARLSKSVSENELKALRSQMNPHFNSNAIGSVISKVRNGQRDEAIDYLTRFSRLMDGVLRNSDFNVISLQEELEVLKTFIGLQEERFANNFSHNIIIDPRLEIDELKVPSLIIQPYVENAIEHGLSNRKEGNLEIRLSLENEMILITIKDDGPGIIKSESDLKERNRPSMGSRISEERIQLFNSMYQSKGTVRYPKTEAGTLVEILLPIIYE